MKKLLFFSVTVLLSCSILFAQNPTKEINKWAAQQSKNIDAGDVVNYLNGGDRAEGDITFGGEYVFNFSAAQNITALSIDSTHFLILYMDEQNSWSGMSVLGTILGNSITFGNKVVFNTNMTFAISATLLDANNFVVVFRDGTNSFFGSARVGSISGNSISYGSKTVFNYGVNQSISVVSLDVSKVIVAYSDNSNSFFGTAVVGIVSGNTISFGNEFIFNAGSTRYNSVSRINNSKFVVSYEDNDNFSYGTCVTGTVSGNTISYGTEYIFNDAKTEEISSTHLINSDFIITYKDFSNGRRGTAIIGTVSENSIIFGTESVFNDFVTEYISVILLDNNRVLIAYDDTNYDYSHKGSLTIGVFNGNSISFGSEYIFNAGRTIWCSATAMDNNSFVVAYTDWDNNFYGTAIYGEIEGSSIPPIPINNWAIIIAILLMSGLLIRKMV